MDINESQPVYTSANRKRGFMLGLILALALLLTGLEWTSRPADTEDNDELLDDMDEDLEMMPAMDKTDMISAVQAPASKSITDKVKAVDQQTSSTDKISPVTSPLVIGNGEAVAKNAEVTEALPQTPVEQDSDVLRTVEKLPEFPGGMVQFMKWLTRNLRYPQLAQQQKIQGKVVVSFIVNKDGSIASPKVEKSVDPNLDREALRVVKMMPKWTPGIMNEKPCRTMVAIPVVFMLK
jgi:protein TonB